MTNHYAKGAKAGAEDFPKNKLASRKLKEMFKNVAGLVPGYENRRDEDTAGYVDTQRAMAKDLHRKQHVVTDSVASSSTVPHIPSGSAAMPNALSAEDQIQLLENLKTYLTNFQEKLIGVSDNYQRKVDALDGGLLTEVHQKFVDDELEPARTLITQLADMIADSSIPAVEKRIAQLENILHNN